MLRKHRRFEIITQLRGVPGRAGQPAGKFRLGRRRLLIGTLPGEQAIRLGRGDAKRRLNKDGATPDQGRTRRRREHLQSLSPAPHDRSLTAHEIRTIGSDLRREAFQFRKTQWLCRSAIQ